MNCKVVFLVRTQRSSLEREKKWIGDVSPRVSECKLHFKRNMEIFWSAECKSFRHPNKQARREGFNKRVHRAAAGSNECAMASVPLLSPSEDCSASGTCIRLIGYSGPWFNKVKRFRFKQLPVFNIYLPWKKWHHSLHIHLKDALNVNNITELPQQRSQHTCIPLLCYTFTECWVKKDQQAQHSGQLLWPHCSKSDGNLRGRLNRDATAVSCYFPWFLSDGILAHVHQLLLNV